MLKAGKKPVAVGAPKCGIEETLTGIAGAAAQEGVGDSSVIVVDDTDGCSKGAGLNVGRNC